MISLRSEKMLHEHDQDEHQERLCESKIDSKLLQAETKCLVQQNDLPKGKG